MLTPEHYSQLHAAIIANAGRPKTSPDQYRRCHHLPGWYSLCQEFTPETIMAARDADFGAILASTAWPGYFVKDFVKSLTMRRGSVAHSPEEIAEVVSLIEEDRGAIEGGVCIRKFECFLKETEERYFVLNGQIHSREGPIPELLQTVAARIDSPFFSADVVISERGEFRLIELGDGQVSSRKKWPVEQFISILAKRDDRRERSCLNNSE